MCKCVCVRKTKREGEKGWRRDFFHSAWVFPVHILGWHSVSQERPCCQIGKGGTRGSKDSKGNTGANKLFHIFTGRSNYSWKCALMFWGWSVCVSSHHLVPDYCSQSDRSSHCTNIHTQQLKLIKQLDVFQPCRALTVNQSQYQSVTQESIPHVN